MTAAKPHWKITVWGVISCLVLVALAATPILVLVLAGVSLGSLAGAAFLILCFWPSTLIVVREAIKERELPRISGGLGVTWAGKTYGPGYRRQR